MAERRNGLIFRGGVSLHKGRWGVRKHECRRAENPELCRPFVVRCNLLQGFGIVQLFLKAVHVQTAVSGDLKDHVSLSDVFTVHMTCFKQLHEEYVVQFISLALGRFTGAQCE